MLEKKFGKVSSGSCETCKVDLKLCYYLLNCLNGLRGARNCIVYLIYLQERAV